MSLDPTPDPATLLRLKAERESRGRQPIPLHRDEPAPRPLHRPRRLYPETLSEHEIQVALFQRIHDEANQRRYPALALCFAVPNGGRRSPAVAAKLKAEGVAPGVPDIVCPAARGGYHGLWLELKRPGGATSPAQASWLAQLAREGHKVALHSTVDGAWAELVRYLDDQPPAA
jgi:hypothetical protein